MDNMFLSKCNELFESEKINDSSIPSILPQSVITEGYGYILNHYAGVFLKEDYGFRAKEPSPLAADGFDSFLYFFEKSGTDSIYENYLTYKSQLPEHFIPIASIDGGNLLCMDINNGYVYIWIHDNEEKDIYLAAESIDVIISSLEKSEGHYDDLGIVNMKLSDRLMEAILNYKE